MSKHTHYCYHCNDTWSHDDPDCTEKPSQELAMEVTDMLCPEHDGLPFSESR